MLVAGLLQVFDGQLYQTALPVVHEAVILTADSLHPEAVVDPKEGIVVGAAQVAA